MRMKRDITERHHDLDDILSALNGWHQQTKGEATLTEIENNVDAALAQLRQQLVSQLAAEEETRTVPIACPNCQKEMRRNGKKKRLLRGKENTTITLEREQMRCPDCGMTFFPPR